MTTYDCLLAEEPVGQVVVRGDALLMRASGDAPCFVCGRETVWVEIDFGCRICSDECFRKLMSEYVGAMSDSLEDWGFV